MTMPLKMKTLFFIIAKLITLNNSNFDIIGENVSTCTHNKQLNFLLQCHLKTLFTEKLENSKPCPEIILKLRR